MVLMSKRELNRIDVLARLDGGRLTTAAAADLMRLTRRQTHRLLKCYRDGGAPAIANRRRGRPSNNRLPDVDRAGGARFVLFNRRGLNLVIGLMRAFIRITRVPSDPTEAPL